MINISTLRHQIYLANQLKPRPALKLTSGNRRYGITTETGDVLLHDASTRECFQWLQGYCTYHRQCQPNAILATLTPEQVKTWINTLEFVSPSARQYRETLNYCSPEHVHTTARYALTAEGGEKFTQSLKEFTQCLI